jgi:hypothetical protein
MGVYVTRCKHVFVTDVSPSDTARRGLYCHYEDNAHEMEACTANVVRDGHASSEGGREHGRHLARPRTCEMEPRLVSWSKVGDSSWDGCLRSNNGKQTSIAKYTSGSEQLAVRARAVETAL